MLRYALNTAISMDSGAPAVHELLLANDTAGANEYGADRRARTSHRPYYGLPITHIFRKHPTERCG